MWDYHERNAINLVKWHYTLLSAHCLQYPCLLDKGFQNKMCILACICMWLRVRAREWPAEGERREGSVREFGRVGMGRSIISTQTPLGFRVRDTAELWRDKSLLLTFERTATYSNNQLRGGGGWAGHNIEFFTFATEKHSSNTLLEEIRLEGHEGLSTPLEFATWVYDLLIIRRRRWLCENLFTSLFETNHDATVA